MTNHPEDKAREDKRQWCLDMYPILKFFDYSHLPDHLQGFSKSFHDVAFAIALNSNRNAETSTCLRKLLEAKDCAVRAAL